MENQKINFNKIEWRFKNPSILEKKQTFKKVLKALQKKHDGISIKLSPKVTGVSVYFSCICFENSFKELRISDHGNELTPADFEIGSYDFDDLFENLQELIDEHQSTDCVFYAKKPKKIKLKIDCKNCDQKFGKIVEKDNYDETKISLILCKKCLKIPHKNDENAKHDFIFQAKSGQVYVFKNLTTKQLFENKIVKIKEYYPWHFLKMNWTWIINNKRVLLSKIDESKKPIPAKLLKSKNIQIIKGEKNAI